ncbi:MAG: TlyA family RNA methyltransferase [Firmicutes bacterium]|nr:TlyA family RNA methyltransferase [Bacillota bacterium]
MAAEGRGERLDQHLVRRGLFATRSQAAAALLAGEVEVEGAERPRPGDRVRGEPAVRLRSGPRYASRGGRKLEAALERWPVPVAGAVCADLGSSTGGFTDCLLAHGARRVYAVDVGRGLLAWRLRQDARVVVREGTNARHLRADDLPERVEVVTADLAFISLTKVAPAIGDLLRAGGHAVCLVKPQFEAGPARVGRRGVVADPADWRRAVTAVAASLAAVGVGARAVMASPILGPEGNAEFLLWAEAGAGHGLATAELEEAVAAALALRAARAGGST